MKNILFKLTLISTLIFLIIVSFSGCISNENRLDSIPPDAVKMSPENDFYPPITHLDDWEQPVPMPGPVNTAGAEDAPVISQNADMFFFFFTPDVRVPPEQQVRDGVTGIWWTKRIDDKWTEPERIILKYGLALDGPLCINDNTLWFCSVRGGNFRELDIYTAELINEKWTNWKNAGERLNVDYLVGELYLTGDGNQMFFHKEDIDGFGGTDLYFIEKIDSEWSEPVNLGPIVNTENNEGWPYVSPDGKQLWFTSWSKKGYVGPAIFRTIKDEHNIWSEPEEVISNFAGDPGIDNEGNIYFTHHFFNEEMEMIEADIYVSYHK